MLELYRPMFFSHWMGCCNRRMCCIAMRCPFIVYTTRLICYLIQIEKGDFSMLGQHVKLDLCDCCIVGDVCDCRAVLNLLHDSVRCPFLYTATCNLSGRLRSETSHVCKVCLLNWKYLIDLLCNLQHRPPGCKLAYLVPVPSQDKLGGLCREGHPA